MTRLAVSVEGKTEEEFVKRVLAGHLRARRIESTPILLGRARGRSGGGSVSLDRLASEVVTLLGSFEAVTTLVDFYGFRKREGRTVEELEKQLSGKIRQKLGGDWDERRMVPYIQVHEFEGLLFSDVRVFAEQNDFPQDGVAALRAVRDGFTTPEEINDDPMTAPSRRIADVIPRYNKSLHGPVLAEEIGLDAIREACPRFHAWVTRLESLGTANTAPTMTL